MKFHREGNKIILTAFILLSIINIPLYLLEVFPLWINLLFTFSSAVFFVLIVQFFRVPHRIVAPPDEKLVICPADGKVVAIEEVYEPEYLKTQCIQVSVFMSPLNVHVNWYPISGIVKYFKYHPGKYLVAWHPKSSTDNERTTVVVENRVGQQVLFRQIAGAVARRIVCYSTEGAEVQQATEFGFIKFGSRVDILLPLGSDVKLKLNEKTKGSTTVLAELPEVATE